MRLVVRFVSDPRVRRTREGPPRDTATRALAQSSSGWPSMRPTFRLSDLRQPPRRPPSPHFKGSELFETLPCGDGRSVRVVGEGADRFFCGAWFSTGWAPRGVGENGARGWVGADTGGRHCAYLDSRRCRRSLRCGMGESGSIQRTVAPVGARAARERSRYS